MALAAGCGTAGQVSDPKGTGQLGGATTDATETLQPAAVVDDSRRPITEKTNWTFEGKTYDKVMYTFAILEEPQDYLVSNLSELEGKSPIIIKARMIKQTFQTTTDDTDPGLPMGNSTTTVHVEQVYKSDGTVKEGQDITVTEWYYPHPDKADKGTLVIESLSQTLPMRPGGEYLLFLNKSQFAYAEYDIFAGWRGQYKISPALKQAASVRDLSREELGVGLRPQDDPSYWGIAQEVKDKYLSAN